ncbi:DUF2959 family protein [Halalkalibaculum sp. DA384]|uniref:DUF2959 family protein n=1 Tax=Halalkalibaculum sp. DA384 TaxID=3373606 RepID=UPI00375479F7
MTPTRHINRVLLSAIIAGFVMTAGCQSTGMERSDETRISLQTMDDDITSAIRQLDATGAALGEILRPGQPDLKKALEAFSDNAAKIVATETKFARHADELTEHGTDYFEEWQQEGTEYNNPKIQQLSDRRRSILGGVYGRISAQSTRIKDSFKTYASDITEIKVFLSNDLSANGVTAIAPIARRVISEGDSLKQAMQNVQSIIQSARNEMAQSGSGL